MARSEDPKKDLMRCADLLNECDVLLVGNSDIREIYVGIAERIRDNVLKLQDYGPRPSAGA